MRSSMLKGIMPLLGALLIGSVAGYVLRDSTRAALAQAAAQTGAGQAEKTTRTPVGGKASDTGPATVSVRYIVNDVDAAIEFYTEHLGFRVDLHPAPGFANLSRATSAFC
jgi:hypothetical protein